MEEIINKVKESGLINLDLAKYQPQGKVLGIDIAEQLWQGLVLKEKDFRTWIKENDWSIYDHSFVFIHCSADAIVPTWAYMLVASALSGLAQVAVVGNKEQAIKAAISKNISAIDLESLKDGRIIIKGCSDIPFPDFAMCCMIEHLQPVAKSIMYGEPCSTVPIFKRKS
jgi:hypothetical protein